MRVDADTLIPVYDAWNGWHNAEVRLGAIRDLHWSLPEHAPRQLLYGVVSCTDIVSGRIPHDCVNATAPHTLVVCVLKRHVVSDAYAALVRGARAAGHLVATTEKSIASASFTATTPPTEIGLMPNSDCLISKRPVAVSASRASSTRTGTTTDRDTSRTVS